MSMWLRRLLTGVGLLVLSLLIAFQVAVRTLRAQVEGGAGSVRRGRADRARTACGGAA